MERDSNIEEEHVEMFPIGKDKTIYRKLTDKYVKLKSFENEPVLIVEPQALRLLAETAFTDVNFLYRTSHLQQLADILDDEEATNSDRFVAWELLKNANISASGVLPSCQDTGTITIVGKKGRRVWSHGDDRAALVTGGSEAYRKQNFRYSMFAPISTFEEKNTGNNLPAQIDIYASGQEEYEFLFLAKGGGSANKTFLHQASPSILTEERMLEFLSEQIRTLGTQACPPYHFAIVIGGTSAEANLKAVKLATTRYLDELPTKGSKRGHAFRDLQLEAKVLEMTRNLGVGAQFAGKYFCHDVRVIRLPRHGASLPIGLGVSCSADRQIRGKINRDGVFLEKLEADPTKFMPDIDETQLSGDAVSIDLTRPMKDILAQLTKHPMGTRLSLSGPLIVARDMAHRALRQRLEAGEPLPDYFKESPVYYAGPAKTPEGYASGSFGPTSAGRMDMYVDPFQKAGGLMVMMAKGNRGPSVRKSCQENGGFYLGSIGGPAALLAQDCIKKVECVEYEEFGMEAIWRIEVEDFPAFIVIDDKGNDFFEKLNIY